MCATLNPYIIHTYLYKYAIRLIDLSVFYCTSQGKNLEDYLLYLQRRHTNVFSSRNHDHGSRLIVSFIGTIQI